jgi:hypothetical protein
MPPKKSFRQLLSGAHAEAGVPDAERTRRATIREVVRASLPSSMGGNTEKGFGWAKAQKMLDGECKRSSFVAYKKAAMGANGDVEHLNFKRGRKQRVSMIDQAAIVVKSIHENQAGHDIPSTDVEKMLRAASGSPMCTRTVKRTLNNIKETYRLSDVQPDVNTANRHENNFDCRNALAHAAGWDFVSHNPKKPNARLDPRLSFNIDATGVGDRAGKRKTAASVLHPRDSKRPARTIQQGRSLERSVKLISGGTSAGQVMPQVYPFHIESLESDIVPITLKGFAPNNQPVHVLLVKNSVTGPEVVSFVLQNIFAPWAKGILSNMQSHGVEMSEEIAALLMDGDAANLKALDEFLGSTVFEDTFEDIDVRVALLSASQSNHEQEEDGSQSFKLFKVALKSDEAHDYMKMRGWEEAFITRILVETPDTRLTRTVAEELTSILIRAQYAHSKVFTIGHRSEAATVLGHFPFSPEVIFARHEGMSAAPRAVQEKALSLIRDGTTFEVFKRNGTFAESDFDDWGIPETQLQAERRSAGKLVKSEIKSLARWRFTLVNHPSVLERWKQFQKIAREKAIKREKARRERQQKELNVQRFKKAKPTRPKDILNASKDKYAFTEDRRCHSCGGYFSTWVKFDLGNTKTCKFRPAMGEPLQYYCGLKLCNEQRKALNKQRKPEITARKAAKAMAKKAVAAAKKAAAAARKEIAARRKAETVAAKKAKQDAALIAKAVDQEVNAAKRKVKKRKRDIFHAQCDSCDQWVEVETLPTTEQWYCDTCPEP